MDIVLGILKGILEEGLLYAVLALGVYITYSILDFPDLTVDGTLPLGAVITAVLIRQGVNPWLCLLVSFAGGMLAGSVTGLLHVKLKIRPLLCGILVMTALLSINLVLVMAGTGGSSVAPFYKKPTIFSESVPASFLPKDIGGLDFRVLIIALAVILLCKWGLDWYLTTKSGLLLRATGNNAQYVTMLARNPGTSKVLGLALGNGFAALAGAVLAQKQQSADLQMGTGMVVLGLASVIMGLSLFGKVRFLKPTTKVILGSILYKLCLSVASELGLPSEYQKLLMVVIFVLVLVFGNVLDKGRGTVRD